MGIDLSPHSPALSESFRVAFVFDSGEGTSELCIQWHTAWFTHYWENKEYQMILQQKEPTVFHTGLGWGELDGKCRRPWATFITAISHSPNFQDRIVAFALLLLSTLLPSCCNSPQVFLKFVYSFYSKGRGTQWNRSRQAFYPLVYSSNVCESQVWVRPKPKAGELKPHLQYRWQGRKDWHHCILPHRVCLSKKLDLNPGTLTQDAGIKSGVLTANPVTCSPLLI